MGVREESADYLKGAQLLEGRILVTVKVMNRRVLDVGKREGVSW